MTRLSEAILLAITVFAVWYRALRLPESQLPFAYIHVQLFPIYAAVLFGIISATIVLYRVFTFNNCEEANAELLEQIKEAKADLTKRGFVFRNEKAGSKKEN